MRVFLLLLLSCSFLNVSVADSATRPNVIFILADDLGWSDTTLYGTTDLYRTPGVEALAKRGMTFTRAYSASPLCSPTRASILTGLSPARHGITAPNCHLPKVILEAQPGTTANPSQKATQPVGVTRLKTDYVTLAETLQQAGYATGHFGKWHLGAEPYSALQHGFDVDVPHWPGPGPAGSYVAPWKFPDFDHDPGVPHQHLEDRMADEAVDFMREHADKPFFLNYWMFSVHAPFDAKRELIEKYRQQVDPDDEQRCPTYAAMIESMDDAVVTLLRAVDQLQIADRTVIIFASDNGGNMYNVVEGERPTSNRPLRGGKATMYEGGIRGPAVVVWPGTVAAGSRSDQIVQSMDYYPTVMEILGLDRSAKRTFDGVSLVPALRGQPLQRKAIFTYFPHSPSVPDWLPPSISVHRGDWKLIRIFHGGENGRHRWKLFNLQKDIGEKDDVAADHPDLVRELDGLIEQHLIETGAVVPTVNPNFDPARYAPEKEGVPSAKHTLGKSRRSITGGKPVSGWTPIKNCRIKHVPQKGLTIQCVGADPHFDRTFDPPLPGGQYKMTLSLSSDTDSTAQFFWSEVGVGPKYAADRRESFSVKAAGSPHTYSVTFTAANRIQSIRLDPLSGAGEVILHSIDLNDGRGSPEFRQVNRP